jgi:hypothetical protein
MKTNCGHSLQNYDSKIAHTYHTLNFSGPNSCPEIKFKIGKMYYDILTCVSETWTVAMEDIDTLRIFERKIMREIYGLVKKGKLENERKQQVKRHIPRG